MVGDPEREGLVEKGGGRISAVRRVRGRRGRRRWSGVRTRRGGESVEDSRKGAGDLRIQYRVLLGL